MSLASAYKIIRPSVVAIAARGSTRPDFPLIIGTGVIVDADGYILTNDHVLEALVRLPRRPGAPPEEWPGMVLLFHLIPEKGMATIPLEIVGVAKLGMNPVPENYYGGQPDLGIIHVGQVKGLPAAKIGPADLPVGSDIGILGFPMGTDTLAAPGWIHQVTPTLQRGIISAQLPYECEAPHELMIDAVIEGGASGSPVFDASNGQVVGLVYGGLGDIREIQVGEGVIPYTAPTSHTLAVSNFFVRRALDQFQQSAPRESADELAKRTDFQDYLTRATVRMMTPRDTTSGMMRPVEPPAD